MELDVCARDFELTPALRQAVETSVREFRRQFPRGFGPVSVRLYDVNGTRGGRDKACLVHVRLGRHRTAVVATDIDADLYRAIASAFAKLGRGARAALERARIVRRPVSTRLGLPALTGPA
jgi:ribosome-associated translation inhibitor RaiA